MRPAAHACLRSFLNRRPIWLLLPILAVAAGLRGYKSGAASTWSDERGSILSATGHLGDWGRMPVDVVIDPPDYFSVAHQASLGEAWRSPDIHPPLFAMILRVWREVFGESDAAERALSVTASVIAIICFYDLARTLAGTTAALWACAIMAVAYPEIRYAQEIRGYALWSALALGAAAAAARLIHIGPGWRRAVALNLAVIAMLLTHLLAAGSAVAIFIWCALRLRGAALRQTLIVASVCLPLAAIAAGPVVWHGIQASHQSDWMTESSAGHLAQTLWRMVLLPARFLAVVPVQTEAAAAAGAAAYFLPFFLWRRHAAMLWAGLWLMCGVGLIVVLDLLRGTMALSMDRFTLAAAPAVYLILAALPLRGGLKHVLPLLAVIGCVLCLGLELPADVDITYKGQWRELGGDVHRLAGRDDVVIFASSENWFLAEPRKLFQGISYYSRPIPCPVLLLDEPIDAVMEQRLRQAAHVWMITPLAPANPAGFLPGWRISAAAPKRRYCGQLWSALLP